MKKLFFILPVLLVCGCASLDRGLYTVETVPASTNVFVLPDGSVKTNVLTRDVLIPKPEVAAAITGAASLLPFGGVAAVGLGWLYSAYAALRNKKVSVALVRGIEAGREALQAVPEWDRKVRDALIRHQEAADVLDAASKLVREYTGRTARG